MCHHLIQKICLASYVRMEKIEVGSWSSQAKMTGTLVSIVGAFVVVFYKGPPVISRSHLVSNYTRVQPNWVTGGVALAAEYIIVSIWYTYQVYIYLINTTKLNTIFLHDLDHFSKLFFPTG